MTFFQDYFGLQDGLDAVVPAPHKFVLRAAQPLAVRDVVDVVGALAVLTVDAADLQVVAFG